MAEEVDLENLANRIRGNLAREREARLRLGLDFELAKKSMPHGKFGKWLKAEFSINVRTAQRYIQYAQSISKLMDVHDIEYDSLSYLSSEAACALAASTRDVQDAIIEDIQLGFQPQSTKVKRCSSQGRNDALVTAAQDPADRIVSIPSLKGQFGAQAAEAAQKAVRLLREVLPIAQLIALDRLVQASGPDAFSQALFREVLLASSGASHKRH